MEEGRHRGEWVGEDGWGGEAEKGEMVCVTDAAGHTKGGEIEEREEQDNVYGP